MKHLILFTTISLVLLSCSNKKQTLKSILASGDVKTIQTKKDELVVQQQHIAQQIKQLDDSLEVLQPKQNLPLVTALVAKAEIFNHFVELQGSVETKQNIIIAPEMNGILQHVFVKEGDKVYKNQILAEIDDGGLVQQKAQLKIQADLAKTSFERQKRLWNQNIGSEMQYLNAKSNYEALEESVNQINKQLAKTTIKAPFSGIIDDVFTEQGSVVSAGVSNIMRIVNLSDMYIKTEAPENYITSIISGKIVEIFFPVLGKSMYGKVEQTGNFINPENRTFSIQINITNKDKLIKPNLTARLKINDYTNGKAILIPQSIISENAEGKQYVYILNNIKQDIGVAEQIIITTGKTKDDHIEVIDGLKANMPLILEGARSVKNGQTVKIMGL